jgi:hypothetical protein
MDSQSSKSSKPLISSVLFVVAGMLVFLVATTYLRISRGNVSGHDEQRSKERIEIRDKTLSASKTLVESAAWVDKAKGIARIPVTDAMPLALTALAAKPVGASSVAYVPPVVVTAGTAPVATDATTGTSAPATTGTTAASPATTGTIAASPTDNATATTGTSGTTSAAPAPASTNAAP